MAVVGSTILKTPQLGILIQGLSWTSALANLGIRSYDSNEHFSIQNKLQHVQCTDNISKMCPERDGRQHSVSVCLQFVVFNPKY